MMHPILHEPAVILQHPRAAVQFDPPSAESIARAKAYQKDARIAAAQRMAIPRELVALFVSDGVVKVEFWTRQYRALLAEEDQNERSER